MLEFTLVVFLTLSDAKVWSLFAFFTVLVELVTPASARLSLYADQGRI